MGKRVAPGSPRRFLKGHADTTDQVTVRLYSFRLIVKVSMGDDIFTEQLPHDIFM
jgi:hypothetical protein